MENKNEIMFRSKVFIEYPNVIKRGAVKNIGSVLKRWVSPQRNLVVLSDNKVASIYSASVLKSLEQNGWNDTKFVEFPSGELSKSVDGFNHIINEFITKKIHRHCIIINLGGGVTCDLGGYVAASYMRGLDYINVPTTLMGLVDAGVGGKVAINHHVGKNLIGSFYHPLAVLIDADVLATLPEVQLRNGMAEALKVSLISSLELFEYIEKEALGLIDPAKIEDKIDRVIFDSVRIKVNYLIPDPYEKNLVRKLNFGHTFAHPLETACGFNLPHGSAVAIGMAIATRVAMAREFISGTEALRILNVISSLGLPTELPHLNPEEIWDKHTYVIRSVRGNNIHFVLPTSIGSVRIINDLKKNEFLKAYLDIKYTNTINHKHPSVSSNLQLG